MDPRFEAFASTLVTYSTNVQPGEIVLVDSGEDTPESMVRAVFQEVRKAGGLPFSRRLHERLIRQMMLVDDPRLYQYMAKVDLTMLENSQKAIRIRGFDNIFSASDVPAEVQQNYVKYFREPVLTYIRNHDNWVLSRWPTAGMAQLFGISVEQMEDLFFRAVSIDYAKMSAAMQPLKELMDRTDQVRIFGPDTDLAFSIKGVGAVACDGHINIPDGECFSAPVKGTMNGNITYNTKAITHEGKLFEGIHFWVVNGRIVEATCRVGSVKDLNSILDTDEGARAFGEFALGFNPVIPDTYGETLFDEKVAGSFHLTPGGCIGQAKNGNQSGVHWDIVCVQTPQKGGGEIWFDGVLVRKDGLFVLPELQGLNPDRLLAV